jgi:hypothetical protein
MDLGINLRSLTRSRRRAKYEGYQLLFASYLHARREDLVTAQIQNRSSSQDGMLDNLKQHLYAINKGVTSSKPFVLILEDDAVPNGYAWNEIENYLKSSSQKRLLAFVGSRANLTRTSSDIQINEYGFF